jgi:hypothetical protein
MTALDYGQTATILNEKAYSVMRRVLQRAADIIDETALLPQSSASTHNQTSHPPA